VIAGPTCLRSSAGFGLVSGGINENTIEAQGDDTRPVRTFLRALRFVIERVVDKPQLTFVPHRGTEDPTVYGGPEKYLRLLRRKMK